MVLFFVRLGIYPIKSLEIFYEWIDYDLGFLPFNIDKPFNYEV